MDDLDVMKDVPSDMPNVFTSTVEHFGSPGTVGFTAYNGQCMYSHHFLNINGPFRHRYLLHAAGYRPPDQRRQITLLYFTLRTPRK